MKLTGDRNIVKITQNSKLKSSRFAPLIRDAGGEKAAQNHNLKVKTRERRSTGKMAPATVLEKKVRKETLSAPCCVAERTHNTRLEYDIKMWSTQRFS
jgi:hypothetical protein